MIGCYKTLLWLKIVDIDISYFILKTLGIGHLLSLAMLLEAYIFNIFTHQFLGFLEQGDIFVCFPFLSQTMCVWGGCLNV